MTVLNPPGWLQNAGATHTAAELRSYVGALLGPPVSANSLIPVGGVSPHLGFQLQVTQAGSPNMTVIVKSGAAWIPGTELAGQGAYAVMNDGDVSLTVTSNGSGQPRIDSVFFKVQDTQYSGATDAASLVLVAGTPSGSPVHPAAPNNSIRLADVAVANGAVSIVTANITDTRTYLGTASGTKVPDVQVFTSSGTWTKPLGARYTKIQVQAGGGAGGGAAAASTSQHSDGAGGGGGGYAESTVDSSTLAATVAVTVGAGGTGVSGAAGNNGSNSSFGAIVAASGGLGGTFNAATTGDVGGGGGQGGAGTAGQVQIAGGGGNFCYGTGVVGFGGAGGSAVLGGGGFARGNNAVSQSQQGGDAGNYGGGGGGSAVSQGGGTVRGGNGGNGVVIVTTYL